MVVVRVRVWVCGPWWSRAGVFFGVLGGFFEGSGSGVGEVVAVPAGHVFAGACVVGD